jgi:hypothetical protein
MKNRILVVLAAACTGVAAWGSAGCGSKSGTAASISGKVLYKGQPLTGGDIAFHPKTKGAIPYSCKIKTDGSFSGTLSPDMLGEVVVTVQTIKPPKKGGQSKIEEEMRQKNRDLVTKVIKTQGNTITAGTALVAVPEKYAQAATSPLRWTITAGSNTTDFELTD